MLRHGPCTTWAQSAGVERDRAAQAVLVAIADAANRDGENSHPGLAAMIDASGYARSTVFRALDRLVALGYVVIDEQGGGRGMATVYSIPGVLDDTWRPGSETVPLRDPPPAGNGPADDAKRSRSRSETVPSSAGAPLFPTDTDATEGPNAVSDVARVFAAWVLSTGRSSRTLLDPKRRRLIENALRGYPIDDVLDAVAGWEHSAFHRGENDTGTVHNDLGLLLRDAAHVERFRDLRRAPAERRRRQATRGERSDAVLDDFLRDSRTGSNPLALPGGDE